MTHHNHPVLSRNQIDAIIATARMAGDAIMPYWRANTDVTRKTDGSPVTIADGISEDIIVNHLQTLTPDTPIIAEELAEAGNAPDVSNINTFWLVDPLDGTKEFVKGTRDFTVNIGLIHDGNPVFGLVYLPATGDLYYGGAGLGAFLNNAPIQVQDYSMSDGLVMVGSASHPDPKKQQRRKEFLKNHKIQKFTTRGSSLKFCLVADGTAHLYPRFIPTYEWDTAAAHAILLQVGGDIIDFETKSRLAYGKFDKNYLNGSLVTGTNTVLKLLMN